MPQLPPDPLPLDPENPYVLVPLHQYPEFTFQCATLLNIEWPRSRQARLNSLWSCNKNFPVGMVLVQTDVKQAIGFCKISLIPNVKGACFVESVVIQPEIRGKGLGSLLMKKLEGYILSRKLHTVYLSTLGQEKFYEKLGYYECEPVSLYSFGLNSNSTAHLLRSKNESLESSMCEVSIHKTPSENCCKTEQKRDEVQVHSPPPPSPPPPPPLPSLPKASNGKNVSATRKVKRKKSAYLVFLAPPLPPPPPPPLPKKPIGKNVMNDKTYMKKELREC